MNTLYETLTLDAQNVRITQDGYLVASPRVARTGIQLYGGDELGRPDLTEVRVFRPEGEVFSTDSLHSYAHRPVTVGHPRELVDSRSWRDVAVGFVGGEIARDGDFVRVPMVLMDDAAVRAVRDGTQQLSLGYTTDLRWESGVAPDGSKYDAVQTNIRANHLAVVPLARGGELLRIGDRTKTQEMQMADAAAVRTTTITVDGIPVEVADVSAKVIERHLDNLQKQVDKLKGDLAREEEDSKKAKDALLARDAELKKLGETSSAEVATLKKQLDEAKLTPVQIDAMVRDRADTLARAKAALGDRLVVDGKTDAEVRRQVVEARMGDAAKGWSDDAVAASFATLTADAAKGTGGRDALADALGSGSRSAGGNQKAVDEAYAGYLNHIQTAYRGGTKAA